MSEEEIEQARKDFEIALLLNNPLLPCKAGCLQKGPDGLYIDPYFESAWRGYQIRAQQDKDDLARFSPMRYISPGMLTQFREVSDYDCDEIPDREIHDSIRCALTVAGGTPT